LYFSASWGGCLEVSFGIGITASVPRPAKYLRNRVASNALSPIEGEAGDTSHENVKACDVVPLTRQQHEANQIAKCVDERCNLRGQAAARLADGKLAKLMSHFW
jgi:hypothetical protein